MSKEMLIVQQVEDVDTLQNEEDEKKTDSH